LIGLIWASKGKGIPVSAEVSRKSINAIENGIYIPSTVLALKIAKTIKCKVEDLFRLP
jgi:putative transcriptional regulator|tara:strand:- start:543 stop:716 length:174 start_codon:yes stop_codon:yes gene_type:complete